MSTAILSPGKKNVYLCQVNNTYGNNVFLPYSTGIIMAYCLSIERIKENYEFKDNLFSKDGIDCVVNKLENPDVFAFSSYIWNFEYNKKLAKQVKNKYPNCLIVFGGHHVPYESEGFFDDHSYIDILAHGDGEIIFSEVLLENLLDKKDFSKISNLSININKKTLKTERKKGNLDLNKIPSPYLTGVFDKIIKLPYSFTASLETNRGCPYGCAYCDYGSPLTYLKKIVPFDEERVKDEIEWFGKNKIEFIWGCDANFGILPRDNQFIDKFIEVKNKHGFPQKFRVTYAKNSNQNIFEMNKKLNNSKMCKGATLSFQSFNPKTLEAVGRINMSTDNFRGLLQQYNNEGIPTYTEIILGLPHETYDTFCDGLNTLLENGQHSSINIYNCEILPNSLMGDKNYQEKYGIKTVVVPASMVHSVPDSAVVQEHDEIVVGTNSMPVDDWKRACIFSWAIQCFHCLGLLQYAAIFAHSERGISYARFYNDLIKFAEDNPNTILGRELNFVKKIIDGVINGNSWEFVIKKFGDVTWSVEEGSFLNIVCEKKVFYDQLKNYLASYLNEDENKISNLLNYSDKMIIDPFCKNTMELKLDYDFNKYLGDFYRGINKPELMKQKNNLVFENIREFNGDLKSYATEIIWYGRKGGRFFHSQDKIKNAFTHFVYE
jgi:radical SAM superfamily enzyme YgiQ (UPF0313 family)